MMRMNDARPVPKRTRTPSVIFSHLFGVMGFLIYLGLAGMSLAEVVDYNVANVRTWEIVITAYMCYTVLFMLLPVVYVRIHLQEKTTLHEEHPVRQETYAVLACLVSGIACGVVWSFESSYTTDTIKLFDAMRFSSTQLNTQIIDIRMLNRWNSLHLFIVAMCAPITDRCYAAFRRFTFPLKRAEAAETEYKPLSTVFTRNR